MVMNFLVGKSTSKNDIIEITKPAHNQCVSEIAVRGKSKGL